MVRPVRPNNCKGGLMISYSKKLGNSQVLLLASFWVLGPLVTRLFSQVEWTASDRNPVFDVGAPGAWDSAVYAQSLLEKDGAYSMWYVGQGPMGRQIGCAHSTT